MVEQTVPLWKLFIPNSVTIYSSVYYAAKFNDCIVLSTGPATDASIYIDMLQTWCDRCVTDFYPSPICHTIRHACKCLFISKSKLSVTDVTDFYEKKLFSCSH